MEYKHEPDTPITEAAAIEVTEALTASEATAQTAVHVSQSMVRLKTYQVIAHKAGIAHKFWPVVAEFYKEIMFNGDRWKHPLDTDGSYKCISSKEWNRITGTTRDARVVQSILKREVCNVIDSYADGKGSDGATYPKGYAMRQEYIDAVSARAGTLITRKQFDAMGTQDFSALNTTLRALEKRKLKYYSNSGDLEKLPAHLTTVDLNIDSIVTAYPALHQWQQMFYAATEDGTGIDVSTGPELLRKEVNELLKAKGVGSTSAYLKRTLGQLSYYRDSDDHTIRQEYRRLAAGRLYGLVGNLQQATNLALKIAMNGCHDYDIKCCVHSICLQTSIKADLPNEALSRYVADRSKERRQLRDDTGIVIDDVKQALTALAYGAQAGPYGSIRKILSKEDEHLLLSQDFVRQLQSELSAVFRHIVATIDKTPAGRKLINPRGNKMELKGMTDGQIVAAFVQGTESMALDALLDEYSSARVAKFDGLVTAQSEDVEAGEVAMAADLGYLLKLDKQRFEIDGLPLC